MDKNVEIETAVTASGFDYTSLIALGLLCSLCFFALGVFFARTHWKTVDKDGKREGQGWGFDSNRAIGVVLLVFAAVTLVFVGKDLDTTAAYTLLGALAGYLFNKEAPK